MQTLYFSNNVTKTFYILFTFCIFYIFVHGFSIKRKTYQYYFQYEWMNLRVGNKDAYL